MTLAMCICQVGPYFCTNLAVHNFSTPLAMDSFLHAKSRIHATFLSSFTSSNPVTTFFIFSINSCLSLFNALHLIRSCFTSSTSPLSHSVHFLSSLFKPLHLLLYILCHSLLPLLEPIYCTCCVTTCLQYYIYATCV